MTSHQVLYENGYPYIPISVYGYGGLHHNQDYKENRSSHSTPCTSPTWQASVWFSSDLLQVIRNMSREHHKTWWAGTSGSHRKCYAGL